MKYRVKIEQIIDFEINTNETSLSDKKIIRKELKGEAPFLGTLSGGFENDKYYGYSCETRDKMKIISIEPKRRIK